MQRKYEASAEDLFEGLTSLSTSVKLISFSHCMEAKMWQSFGLIIIVLSIRGSGAESAMFGFSSSRGFNAQNAIVKWACLICLDMGTVAICGL